MNADGSDVKRITFKGSYNISPSRFARWKYHSVTFLDAMVAIRYYAMDLINNNQELKLSDTNRDESPSFAPNGRYVLYATQAGRRGTLRYCFNRCKSEAKTDDSSG